MTTNLKEPNASEKAGEVAFSAIHRSSTNFGYDRVLDVDLCDVREARAKQGYAAEKIYKSESPFGTVFTLTWQKAGAYADPNQQQFPTPPEQA